MARSSVRAAVLLVVVAVCVVGCRRDQEGAAQEAVPTAGSSADPMEGGSSRAIVHAARPHESNRFPSDGSVHSTAEVPGPQWQPDLATALREARQVRRPVMVLIAHRGLGGSVELRRDGLSDPEVARLARSFVCIQFEYEAAPEEAQGLGVVAVPCIVFLYPDGDPCFAVQGYGGARRVAAAMRQALSRYGSQQKATDGPESNS